MHTIAPRSPLLRPVPPTLAALTLVGSLAVGCGPSKDELQADLDEVRAKLTQSQTQVKTLEGRIAELKREIVEKNGEIEGLQAKVGTSAADLEELRKAKAAREAELATYEQLFAKLKTLIDAGTVRVVFRKGKMMVEMSSAVLFDSGKAKLKNDGMTTLTQLNEALTSVADRDFLIAGHTDNVPIKTRQYKSNWELSTQRAVVVVNHMIEQGFPKEHIGAAGYADVEPVADNDTEEGRAQNRRIDIILMPNLGELKGIREMLEKQTSS